MTKKINEGMGSVNVEQEYDVSRIQKLAGIANSSTASGTPVVNEDVMDDISGEDAREFAGQLEEKVAELDMILEEIIQMVRHTLPREYRSMEAYTFAHIKQAIGGHGYMDNRMSTSLIGLIEELNERGDTHI